MKKLKGLLALFCAAALLFCGMPTSLTTADAAEYQAGDVIEFGSYPQTRVTDEALITALDAAAEELEWQWLAEIKTAPSTRYAQFKDITYNGMRYRKYFFTAYRNGSGGVADTIPNYMQYGNGYYKNTEYWFSFDPISWTVVDPESGLLIANAALDALPVTGFGYGYNSEYYIDETHLYYMNNYSHSTIRSWLNEDFRNTAFSEAEADVLLTAEIDNQTVPSDAAQFACENTIDTVFLPSLNEAQLLTGGRIRPGSDYALAQGVWNYGQGSGQFWFLRTPGGTSKTQRYVKPAGGIASDLETASRDVGIVPAARISFSDYEKMLASTSETPDEPDIPDEPNGNTSYQTGDIIEFGNYPQTRVTDEALITTLEEAAVELEWQSLGYEALDQEPFAFYKDVELDGTRYRAQMYTEYRNAYSGGNGIPGTNSVLRGNGYLIDATYWFRYEPIQWKVLDPEIGLLFPEKILDAQAINKAMYNESGDALTGETRAPHPGYDYADAAHQYYLNNYAHSNVRDWLTSTFIATAFSTKEHGTLRPIEIDNSVAETGDESFMQYGSENTTDAVFLLSFGDAAEPAYFADNAARCRTGTDYAKAQGLYRYDPSGSYEYWYLRSPATAPAYHAYVTDTGSYTYGCETLGTDIGICPAVTISLEAYDALNAEEPNEPDEPVSSPYDSFSFDYAEGILTVSGNGILPSITNLADTPLAPYAAECDVIVLGDGVTTVASNAFAGYDNLSVLILNGRVTLADGAFASNDALQTVICADRAAVSAASFAGGTDIFFYEPKAKPHTGMLQGNCTVLPYSFANGTLSIEGSVEMDTYALLDLMAVMCGWFDDIHYVKFDSYTSLDLPVYIYNKTTGKYERADDDRLTGVSFSVKLPSGNDWETITFNEFCQRAQEPDLGSFRLVTETETEEEVQENTFRIILEEIQSSIRRALKWIVSLLNTLFKLLSAFGK